MKAVNQLLVHILLPLTDYIPLKMLTLRLLESRFWTYFPRNLFSKYDTAPSNIATAGGAERQVGETGLQGHNA